jgi:4-amino-4-deoxy-L-arabinose transferase-like glycosyltransferase
LLFGDWRYGRDILAFLQLLPWFSWPLWPLAGWTAWQKRRQWKNVEILLPLVACVVLFFVLPICVNIRESTAILILPPLALLATPGALSLRRGAANAFDWFAGMVFSVFAILLWTGWSAMIFGHPARLAQRAVELEPGFVGRFDFWFFALAVLVTLWWGWLLLKLPRSPWRCFTSWSAGLAIGWLLAVSLWLPWIDYGKSYRPTAATLAAKLPKNVGCIAEWHVGSAQLASFAYFERLRFTPLESGGLHCRWLLTQGNSRAELTPPGQGWQRVWEGNRPGDRKERFRLYRRSPHP